MVLPKGNKKFNMCVGKTNKIYLGKQIRQINQNVNS